MLLPSPRHDCEEGVWDFLPIQIETIISDAGKIIILKICIISTSHNSQKCKNERVSAAIQKQIELIGIEFFTSYYYIVILYQNFAPNLTLLLSSFIDSTQHTRAMHS